MPLKVNFTGKTPQQMLAAYEQVAKKVVILAGAEVLNFVADNFKNEGFDTGQGIQKWRPRSPNAPRNDRALLVDRSLLINGIRKTISGNIITISVAPPADKYAAAHNEGVNETVTVKAHTRKNKHQDKFEQQLKKKAKQIASGIATVKAHQMKMAIPKRQFIGDSKELDRRIIAVIEEQMKSVF